ncbi:PilZ domain-containing protein [Parerythrobacter jejuensis]|uniref:PilZ domain-containing protein n=1 Tax=Parerythrobacter jejuensis TaxID=795812 RepID=A0A845AV81_9SPHN|nr:PilZ domain-containing protein [Parerythrobacter jejuensis]MXP30738.1 PilZ domain-containing protein [Parerythrobacter jejuensis]MXP33498.1 PilZ domain-containing protein [Parerythrobacter jejuensis]
MSAVDTRNISRDSMFLMAEVRLEGADSGDRIKVRNLSAGGMMAEGGAKVLRGSRLSVDLRNIGWVDGHVAWVQDNRFGIAFDNEVDPALARAPATNPDEASAPRYMRTSGYQTGQVDKSSLRKI